jgi:hypothetical protein
MSLTFVPLTFSSSFSGFFYCRIKRHGIKIHIFKILENISFTDNNTLWLNYTKIFGYSFFFPFSHSSFKVFFYMLTRLLGFQL